MTNTPIPQANTLDEKIMELFKKDPSIHLDVMPNGDLIEPQCIQDIQALITEIIGELFNEVIGETEKFEEILTSTPRIVGQSNYVKDVRNTLRQQQRGLMGIALRDISELKENK